MNEPSRIRQTHEALQAYLDLGDAIRLVALPSWLTADLTISQAKALFMLANHGPLAVSELAGRLGLGNPAASILVQALVEQGMVERTEDLKDRRRMLVYLTSQGIKMTSTPREQREARLRPMLSQLNDDELAGLLLGVKALVKIARSQPLEPVPDRQ
jgi:DNA-binding MarR family transcriptional regulator